MDNLSNLKEVKKIKCIVPGKGTLFFSTNSKFCLFRILNQFENDGFEICFQPQRILVNRIGFLEPLLDKNNNTGTIPDCFYYWFSIDSQNQRFYAGIGHSKIETVIYQYVFYFDNDELKNSHKSFLESLDNIVLSDEIDLIQFCKEPYIPSKYCCSIN